MTQFHRFFRQLPYRRESSVGLVCCLLLGTLLGAVLAKLTISALPASAILSAADTSRTPIWGRWFHFALFPTLMLAASLLRSRLLCFLLMLLKGAAVSCLLCVSYSIGFQAIREVCFSVLFQTLFPLPILLYIFSVWLQEIQSKRFDFWLLLPGYLVGLIGILLESLLV